MKLKQGIKVIALLSGAAVFLSACSGKVGGDKIKTFNAVVASSDYSGNAEKFVTGDDYDKVRDEYMSYQASSSDIQPQLQGFYQAVLPQLLNKKENTVISPINIYMALSMLAELTAGDTQAEVMKLMNADSIETVRSRADSLYLAHYVNNPVYTEKIASSFWIRDDINYKDDTLKTLSEKYHASSFVGKMGSTEMNKALQDWTNSNTGELLTEYTKDMSTDQDTVMSLVSTIYMKAMWTEPFSAGRTTNESFYGINGEHKCSMMHSFGSDRYYFGEHFGAIAKPLFFGGTVLLILPDEGVMPAELLKDDDVFRFISGINSYENNKFLKVNLSVPKFKASSKLDLNDSLDALGIKKVFGGGDFSSLTVDTGVFLNKAEHAAMLEMDEEGITGAAYTDFALDGSAMPPDEEMDLVFNRPFLAVVKGSDGSILFATVIYEVS